MSQENVEIVSAAIEAFNRGDFDAFSRLLAPDTELDWSRAVGPNRGVYTLDQVRAVWDDSMRTWESTRIEPHEFIEAGEHVAIPWTLRVTGRDGIEVRARVTWTFTIRDGAIQRICMYQERQEALEALGLSEQDAHADS
jgi:ketosteroid isomerase-like protein